MSGILVVSLDFELHWGVHDQLSLAAYRQNLLGVRRAVPAMLETFARPSASTRPGRRSVSSSATSRRELLDALPARRPSYATRSCPPTGSSARSATTSATTRCTSRRRSPRRSPRRPGRRSGRTRSRTTTASSRGSRRRSSARTSRRPCASRRPSSASRRGASSSRAIRWRRPYLDVCARARPRLLPRQPARLGLSRAARGRRVARPPRGSTARRLRRRLTGRHTTAPDARSRAGRRAREPLPPPLGPGAARARAAPHPAHHRRDDARGPPRPRLPSLVASARFRRAHSRENLRCCAAPRLLRHAARAMGHGEPHDGRGGRALALGQGGERAVTLARRSRTSVAARTLRAPSSHPLAVDCTAPVRGRPARPARPEWCASSMGADRATSTATRATPTATQTGVDARALLAHAGYTPYFDSRLAGSRRRGSTRICTRSTRAPRSPTRTPSGSCATETGTASTSRTTAPTARCPQYAGDIGNPAFRAHWIETARDDPRPGLRRPLRRRREHGPLARQRRHGTPRGPARSADRARP